MTDFENKIESIYDWAHDPNNMSKIENCHSGDYSLILTNYNKEKVEKEVSKYKFYLNGKDVIEIGAGIGLLAIEVAKFAKYVYAFELDPAWSWIFVTENFYDKPDNMSFIFGDVRDFAYVLNVDLVIIYAYASKKYFTNIAKIFASSIILNGEIYD